MKLKDVVAKINKHMTPSVQVDFGSGYKRYHDNNYNQILIDLDPDAEVDQIYVSMRELYNIPMLCIVLNRGGK